MLQTYFLDPMKTYLAEPELIKSIKKRKRIAAEALYEQYAVTLYKVICCSVKDQLKAGAILEDTILKVWNTINDYQPKNGRLLLWMSGIARSEAKASMVLPASKQKDQYTTEDKIQEIPLTHIILA